MQPSARRPLAGDADGIGSELHHLVQTYVAYLSGCDACTRDALREALALEAEGSRLERLPAWRRAPTRTYTERERVALVWAEVVALSGEEGIGEALRREAGELFDAAALDALTRIVTTARGWQRLHLERSGAAPRRRRPGEDCRGATGCGSTVSP